jgi:hypothetical protein
LDGDVAAGALCGVQRCVGVAQQRLDGGVGETAAVTPALTCTVGGFEFWVPNAARMRWVKAYASRTSQSGSSVTNSSPPRRATASTPRFSVAHDITGGPAWGTGFVLTALAEVTSRTAVTRASLRVDGPNLAAAGQWAAAGRYFPSVLLSRSARAGQTRLVPHG